MIRQAIDKNHGNWAAAAGVLNMNRSNLHNLVKRLGLKSYHTILSKGSD
ncbi:MAG: hypothetical protein JSV31_18740 [Desulfobacterales bacterium]|nr:MAG: hypothetical protein JSV31_18740 [Desulfobacterales bacterium]